MTVETPNLGVFPPNLGVFLPNLGVFLPNLGVFPNLSVCLMQEYGIQKRRPGRASLRRLFEFLPFLMAGA